MKRYLIVVLCVLWLNGNAQIVFEKTYGGGDSDDGQSVQQTTDGGYIIAGSTNSFGAGWQDFYLIKTNATGDTVWTKTYGGIWSDIGWSVQQTTDGGYIIAGETQSFGVGGRDFYVVKTDAIGDTIWTKTYGGGSGDQGLSVQQTTDGGYVVAGYTLSFGAGGWDFYVVKTDESGDTIWTKTYGGILHEWAQSVQQTTDGGYIIAGITSSFGAGGYDVWLVKTDASGDTIWTKTYGGLGNDWGISVQQTTDGGYVIAGYTLSFGAGGLDIWLIKTDLIGDTVWTKTYGGVNDDWGQSVKQTSDGGYIIAGWTDSYGAGGWDVYLIKTDPFGNTDTFIVSVLDKSRFLEGGAPYPPDARVMYYDLVGRVIPSPGLLLPGQLYITTVYSSTGRLLGHKLQLAP